MALSDDRVQHALSGLDPQEKFPRPTGEEPEAAHLFERGPARYEGDSTVIRVNTTAFPLLASVKDGSHLITTVRESRFWQLVAQHRTLKTVSPLTKPFITCLIASLRDYAEDSTTVRAGLKVTRDVSYWACRQSFLRILVAELGLDTELFCSLLNSFPGLENHFSIIPGDKEWGYKMNAYATQWTGMYAYGNPEYRKEEVRRFAHKCQATIRMASKISPPPPRGYAQYSLTAQS
jgi:hypothetical protein